MFDAKAIWSLRLGESNLEEVKSKIRLPPMQANFLLGHSSSGFFVISKWRSNLPKISKSSRHGWDLSHKPPIGNGRMLCIWALWAPNPIGRLS